MTLIVTGEPKGQPRARVARRGNFAHVYDPGTADNWKRLVILAASIELQGCKAARPVFIGPVRVDITLRFPRPKSHYRSNGELKANAPKYHTAKPDRDNCDKAILDALGSSCLQLWRDDAQVCEGSVTKLYAQHKALAGATICIADLSEPNQPQTATNNETNEQRNSQGAY